MEIMPLTVSQLNLYVQSLLNENTILQNIFVTGEISGFTDHYQSGHYYFSLKDENAVIKVVMFKDDVRHLKFKPENGMNLLIRGRVSLYGATGQYQLYARDMQPEGLGALNLAFVQLKERLQREGLFNLDKKKPLPAYPERIGVITSPIGAALQDILNILNRRFPLTDVVFCPVSVQGESAPSEIARAIAAFEQDKKQSSTKSKPVDAIILGRGGGSPEDLWAFNEEIVARAVFNSKIPVISAVGHETDFTICDFVADMRAPTPSAAAELAVPEKTEVLFLIKSYMHRINEAVRLIINVQKQKVDALLSSKYMHSCHFLLKQKTISLDLICEKLERAFLEYLGDFKQRFANLVGKLELLSPLKILQMGYATLSSKSGPIKSVMNVDEKEKLNVRLLDGKITCEVLFLEVFDAGSKNNV